MRDHRLEYSALCKLCGKTRGDHYSNIGKGYIARCYYQEKPTFIEDVQKTKAFRALLRLHGVKLK